MRWVKSKIVEPLRTQLTQGVSPSRLAAALALGAVLGVFPVLGTTTLLSALAAATLRLNQPAIQVSNYVAYPLQLALYLPFFRAGAALFGGPPVTFTLSQVQAELAADVGGTVVRYVGAAIAGWHDPCVLYSNDCQARTSGDHQLLRCVPSDVGRGSPVPG
jgi:uncharacterized protein (DUF2062 family)